MTKQTDRETAFADALARAMKSRKQLDTATDKLNENIKLVEGAIASLKLGVRGSVVMSRMEHGDVRILAFGKEGEQWRLLVEIHNAEDPEGDIDSMPLVNAPRWVRMAAVPFFSPLVIEMSKNVEKEISSVEESALAAEAFAKQLVDQSMYQLFEPIREVARAASAQTKAFEDDVRRSVAAMDAQTHPVKESLAAIGTKVEKLTVDAGAALGVVAKKTDGGKK